MAKKHSQMITITPPVLVGQGFLINIFDFPVKNFISVSRQKSRKSIPGLSRVISCYACGAGLTSRLTNVLVYQLLLTGMSSSVVVFLVQGTCLEFHVHTEVSKDEENIS